jgi:ribonuclease BN (tRNA processing enzyme)
VGDRNYLVDAGPSTCRRLGPTGVVSQSICAVFVTHMHSDYISDLISLVLLNVGNYQQRLPTAPTPVYGPVSVSDATNAAVSGMAGMFAALDVPVHEVIEPDYFQASSSHPL